MYVCMYIFYHPVYLSRATPCLLDQEVHQFCDPDRLLNSARGVNGHCKHAVLAAYACDASSNVGLKRFSVRRSSLITLSVFVFFHDSIFFLFEPVYSADARPTLVVVDSAADCRTSAIKGKTSAGKVEK
jgi:hypothetical protein